MNIFKDLTFYIISITILLFVSCSLEKQQKTALTNTEDSVGVYDSLLAAKYGADQFGMKKYVVAFLKKGPNKPKDSITAAELQMGHLKNIQRLAGEGKLLLAGPFFGNDSLRGMYIFDVNNIESAKKLTKSDPAIKAGSLTMELKEWYGSAALMAVNDLHRKLEKRSITDN